MKARYTHKGWLGLCPVYVANTYSACPRVNPRHRRLTPLLHFSIWLQEVAIATCSFINPAWEPTWSIRLTGTIPVKEDVT